MIFNDWKIYLTILLLIVLIIFLYNTFFRENKDNDEFIGLRPLLSGEGISEYKEYLNPDVCQIDSSKSITSEDKTNDNNTINNKITTNKADTATNNTATNNTATNNTATNNTATNNTATNNTVTNKGNIITNKDDTPILINYIPTVNKKHRTFSSRGEQICCEIMEKIYGVSFEKTRPNCLKNPETGCNLEIDCYNDKLKLGVEYNGSHHYIFPNNFHRTKEDFINQIRRDQYKVEACDRNGIYLITVPYNVSLNEIENYITNYLPENICKI